HWHTLVDMVDSWVISRKGSHSRSNSNKRQTHSTLAYNNILHRYALNWQPPKHRINRFSKWRWRELGLNLMLTKPEAKLIIIASNPKCANGRAMSRTSSKALIIGIGGMGRNALRDFSPTPDTTLLVIDTDAQALDNSLARYNLLIGQSICRGL